MEPFLVSAGLVAVAEMGDKTQLLTFMLASRYRRPVPIILGILAATMVNHGLAAGFGLEIASWLGSELLHWGLGLGFLGMAVWAVIPDREPAGDPAFARGLGVFTATTLAFFVAEMGDKTQVATIGLAAREAVWGAVTLGTTLGMLIANVPVACWGDRIVRYVPLGLVRIFVAVAFGSIGVAALVHA